MKNYYYYNISELSKLCHDEKVSPVEIVNACLKRIEELNPKFNAFITVMKDQSLEKAKQVELDMHMLGMDTTGLESYFG